MVLFLLDDSEIGKLLRSPSRPLFIATEFGNFQFIRELLLSCPDLIWKVDEQSRSIFDIAVIHRQEKIFKLLYDIGGYKDLITSYKNPSNCNMLHLAANLAPSNRLNIVSGAALQMQRELLWFKEVEKNMLPLYKEMKDSEGRTPQMLFTQEHKGLVESGEKWMKDTASSCMLVATLITTVMFAAIFTVPGGNNNDTGTPMFLKDKSFIIFSMSDALALFSSVTSILMFLSILTSRYAEEDFLESLPKRLIIGLTTLFFSIASMLLAFSASFFIVVGHQLAWIIIPIALTACVPVTLFAFLQFPLLADVMHSTYGSGIFSMERNERLY
ncbi:ankyrin repeat-containing ITN1-like isoform X1 [Olea europaea subsp. europaea]|uniref:Ankyrin repeat-containing ITN1-like isoform X1 n=1 Tax=Olea europaea subsp. europaea TaxID=158383 RepID=A0A8S0P8B5_OLEEU|nr:ankyrin repeat-containing ITN1-like isoform X1 [Olea europaea subsp. europaea]